MQQFERAYRSDARFYQNAIILAIQEVETENVKATMLTKQTTPWKAHNPIIRMGPSQ